MKKILAIIFLGCPLAAHATYVDDKNACYTYGENMATFAQLRDDNLPRETLIDKTLALADSKGWSVGSTLALIYMIQYVYAHPDLSPTGLKKSSYDACMKQRGHIST